MQLCDAKGSPYPTTGFGALVFNTGPTLIDAILLNPLITFDVIKLPGGDFYNPSLQFTTDNSKTPGLYSTGPGNISLVGTSGDESSRVLLASFDHPGNLHVTNLLNIGGTIPPADSSTLAATTQWINDKGYLTPAGAAGLYLPLAGGTLTGPLAGTTATFVGNQGVITAKNNATGSTSLWFRREGAPTDQKTWEVLSSASGNFAIRTANDANTGWGNVLYATRGVGSSVASVVFDAPITANAALTGTTATFSGAAQAARLGVGIAPSATATAKTWTDGDFAFSGINHFIGGNLYYDSGWKYTANGTGGAVALAANSTQSFNVYTAPNNTGGAGAAATPFTALSFDAAGNPTFFGALTGTTATFSGTVVGSEFQTTKSATPRFLWNATGNPTDQHFWSTYINPIGDLISGPVIDAGTMPTFWGFTRSGATNLPGALTGTTATFSGTVNGSNGFFTDTVAGGYVLHCFNNTNETGFTIPFGVRQGNNAAGTNYSILQVEQNAVNDMAIEVVDQANTKGILRLQPFGGTVITGAPLTVNGLLTLGVTSGPHITAVAGQNLNLRAATGQTVTLGVTGSATLAFLNNATLYPSTDNAMALGDPSFRWADVRAANATISGGILNVSGTSATGGHLLFQDTNTGGTIWQTGPGAGSGSSGEWAIYNQGTSLLVFRVDTTGLVTAPVVRTVPVAVASLPAVATVGAGARAMVTNSSVVATGNFGAIVAAGGANAVPVYCDGANWRIG